MDQEALDTLVDILSQIDPGSVRSWLPRLRETALEAEDWDGLQGRLRELREIDQGSTESFLRATESLTGSPRLLIAEMLAEFDDDEIEVRITHAAGLRSATGGSSSSESPWERFVDDVLRVYGSSFDGTDAHWDVFAPWLRERAAELGLAEQADLFIAELDASYATPAARAQRFAEFDVVLSVPDTVTEEAHPLLVDEAAGDVNASAVDHMSADLPAQLPPDEVDWADALLEDEDLEEGDDIDEKGRPVLDDAVLDAETLARVLRAQADLGLVPDGVVGPKTWDSLARYDSEPAGV